LILSYIPLGEMPEFDELGEIGEAEPHVVFEV
jgi:hypothetical protein